jgi:hypothetical protein
MSSASNLVSTDKLYAFIHNWSFSTIACLTIKRKYFLCVLFDLKLKNSKIYINVITVIILYYMIFSGFFISFDCYRYIHIHQFFGVSLFPSIIILLCHLPPKNFWRWKFLLRYFRIRKGKIVCNISPFALT